MFKVLFGNIVIKVKGTGRYRNKKDRGPKSANFEKLGIEFDTPIRIRKSEDNDTSCPWIAGNNDKSLHLRFEVRTSQVQKPTQLRQVKKQYADWQVNENLHLSLQLLNVNTTIFQKLQAQTV